MRVQAWVMLHELCNAVIQRDVKSTARVALKGIEDDMMMRILGVAIMLGTVAVGFQNCARTEFSASSQSSIKAAGMTDETLAEVDEESQTLVATPTDEEENQRDDKECGRRTGRGPQDEDRVSCILDGMGKYLKLSLVEEGLRGDSAVSRDICVTRRACLHEVSKHFQVKGAVRRGYCHGNPNVRFVSDAELRRLLN